MKKLLLAVAAIGLFAGGASAQPYGDGRGGYRPPPPQSDYAPPPRYRQPPRPPNYVPGPAYGGPAAWRHRRPYDWCQAKAGRLHEFEFRMQQDGRVSRDEARIASSLRADLASSCGGGRRHPQRGWHYR